MAKIKTSKKRTTSSPKILCVKLKPDARVTRSTATEDLLNEEHLGKAIISCLKNNDPEGVVEVIETYLETLNMTETSKKAGIPRSTLYHSLKAKNPTIRTLAKLVHASTPAQATRKAVRK